MTTENAFLDEEEKASDEFEESFDFDELEEKLQSQLEEEIADMQFLVEEKIRLAIRIISARLLWMLYGNNL